MRNRKASVEIVVLVLLVLVLTAGTLLSFVLNFGEVKAEILNMALIENVYSGEADREFYIQDLGERAFAEAYDNLLVDGDYIDSRTKDANKNIKFSKIWGDIDERFKVRFVNYFEKLDKKETDVEVVIDDEEGFVKIRSQENFKYISWDKKNHNEQKLKVIYRPKIVVEFNFEKFGLISFHELEKIKNECFAKDSKSGKKHCFRTALKKNFEVGFWGEGSEMEVILTSKKEFFIDGEFRSVELGFVNE